MRIEPEISGVGVELLGPFNPAIFTPAWFAMHEMLPKSAAENADMEGVNDQLSSFSTKRMTLRVTPKRFQAATLVAPYISVRDLVVRVFCEQLYQSPITALGIVRESHFPVPSAAAYDQVGGALAPTVPWGEAFGGHVDVQVEPSSHFGNRIGIRALVIDRYHIGDETPEGRDQLFSHLDVQHFDDSIRKSDSIVDQIMSWVQCQVSPRSPIDDPRREETRHARACAPMGVDERASLPSRMLRQTTLLPLQEWEGYVVAIEGKNFVANLIDLTAGDTVESEEATIPIKELSEYDRPKLKEGKIFRWVIGHEKSLEGTKCYVSHIEFRDMPRVTDRDIERGKAWARKVAKVISP